MARAFIHQGRKRRPRHAQHAGARRHRQFERLYDLVLDEAARMEGRFMRKPETAFMATS